MSETQSEVPEAIRHLVHLVPRAPEDVIPQGCESDALAALESRTGVAFPSEMRAWLRYTNGPCIGPGGMFGIRPLRKSLDIEHHLGLFPTWAERGWLPVAGDGCGNYFVLACDPKLGGQVLFVDTHEVPEHAEVVADDLWAFLEWTLAAEAKV